MQNEICTNMQKYANICICPMSLPQLHTCKNMHKTYINIQKIHDVSMKFICIICTSHFADGVRIPVSRVASRRSYQLIEPKSLLGQKGLTASSVHLR